MNKEKFIKGYIESMLWSSLDDEDMPLDYSYYAEDILSEAMQSIKDDCEDFIDCNEKDLARYCKTYPVSYAGHDFWLTRNGHGAGFWDRGLKDVGDSLTEACRPYGNCHVFVTDDNKLDLEG